MQSAANIITALTTLLASSSLDAWPRHKDKKAEIIAQQIKEHKINGPENLLEQITSLGAVGLVVHDNRELVFTSVKFKQDLTFNDMEAVILVRPQSRTVIQMLVSHLEEPYLLADESSYYKLT